ncbi:hypothetical protein HDV02_005701 [Globomyces sp. JEL0801]|nr:hypothetical protein HDV02_005701 [Globomyces sp. JEL0801]
MNWMGKWPTIYDLANASKDDVFAVWSGLGYYSRANRLLQGAQYIVQNFDGKVPDDVKILEKEIPGVGPYTAGAIVSIAFNKPVPLVDGNVVRVLSRLLALAGDPKSKSLIEMHWKKASEIVDRLRPGDFNQAIMDIGATVCKPTNPTCDKCPLMEYCKAYQEKTCSSKVEKNDLYKKSDSIDDACKLCPPLGDIEEIGPTMYPFKVLKAEARKEDAYVSIVEFKQAETLEPYYLLVKGPEKGLLAGLWDFPQLIDEDELHPSVKTLLNQFDLQSNQIGTTIHKFSHIHRTIHVRHTCINTSSDFQLNTSEISKKSLFEGRAFMWVTESQLGDGQLGLPITLKKSFALFQSHGKPVLKKSKRVKLSKDQTTLDSFFKRQ